jgi:small subunit ribosomal protein S18
METERGPDAEGAPPAGTTAEPVVADPPVAEAPEPASAEQPAAPVEPGAPGAETPAEPVAAEGTPSGDGAPAEGSAPAEGATAAPPGERPRGRPAGGPRGERPARDGDRRRGGGRFGRRKVCGFCVEKAKAVDYKDPVKLRRYLSDRARIEPRRKTGTCAKHQRWLSVALKRARHLALLPYTPEHVRVTGVFPSRR